MTYHVRKYKESDRDAVRKICHLTATAPAYVKNPELVATLYADYYTEFEPDGIFILARDEDDVAVGYILSSLDYKTFVKTFTRYVMPRVRKLSRIEAFTHFLHSAKVCIWTRKNIPRICISTFCPRRNTKDTARNLWTPSWITLPKRA